LGKGLTEIMRAYLGQALPDLYPKLSMGARPLKGTEAEEVLKAANLNGLSQVFYAGEKGLDLVVRENNKAVANPSADVAKEIMGYLVREHSYGNRETRTGKALEAHFGGLGYGWERDMLRVVLAVLLRAGTIEVSHGGQRFDSYQDPQCRVPFANNVAFRSAIFTPVEPIDLKTLTQAVKNYEALVGTTVDVEKGAISTSLKAWAQKEMNQVLPVRAQAQAHNLPVLAQVDAYHHDLQAVLGSTADECVHTLAGEGTSLREYRDRAHRIAKATDDQGLRTLKHGRVALNRMWPLLNKEAENGGLEAHAQVLRSWLESSTFYDHLGEIAKAAQAIQSAYHLLYAHVHGERAELCARTIETIRGTADWTLISQAARESILHDLRVRSCTTLELPEGATRCTRCGATLGQLKSDYVALPTLRIQALARVHELAAEEAVSPSPTRRVCLLDYFGEAINTEADLEGALQHLTDDLHKFLDEGATLVFE